MTGFNYKLKDLHPKTLCLLKGKLLNLDNKLQELTINEFLKEVNKEISRRVNHHIKTHSKGTIE